MSKEPTPIQALEKIRDYVGQLIIRDRNIPNWNLLNNLCDFDKCIDIIKTELKDAETLCKKYRTTNKRLRAKNQKHRKVLKIIKEKKVNVRALIKSFYRPKDGLSVYNSQCCDWQEMESKELTQEEYDFLKEELERRK